MMNDIRQNVRSDYVERILVMMHTLKKLVPNSVKRSLKSLLGLDAFRSIINERLDATNERLDATNDRLNVLDKSVATLMYVENASTNTDDQIPPFSAGDMHPNELAKLVRKRKLRSAETLDDIRQVAAEMGYSYFLDYDQQIDTKKREFLSAINFFNVSLRGTRVLDVGPGTADGLDAAKEGGAAVTLFIDEEPFFVKWAEAKDHMGVEANYYFEPFFPNAWTGTIDLLYSKGAINCEWVNEQHAYMESGDPRYFFDFQAWINCLISLIDPLKGNIILMPAMGKQSTTLVDEVYDLVTDYWCPDIDAYRNGFFCSSLRAAGFKEFEHVEGFTQGKAFPLAFFYSGSGQS